MLSGVVATSLLINRVEGPEDVIIAALGGSIVALSCLLVSIAKNS